MKYNKIKPILIIALFLASCGSYGRDKDKAEVNVIPRPKSLYGVPIFGKALSGARGFITITQASKVMIGDRGDESLYVKCTAGLWRNESQRFFMCIVEGNDKAGRISIKVIKSLLSQGKKVTINVLCIGTYKDNKNKIPVYTFYKNDAEELVTKLKWEH